MANHQADKLLGVVAPEGCFIEGDGLAVTGRADGRHLERAASRRWVR